MEWFTDQKLGIMIHYGPYTQLGLMESWPLVDEDKAWSQVQIDWTKDIDKFKQQYFALNKTFNPIRFNPEKWAETIKSAGAGYVVFTTKHHDGFCMYDTQYTDYKITAPDCPYSRGDYPDFAGALFDACRKRGLGISAYFSRPDWHHEDYWENRGIGHFTTRNPTYNAKENPEKWERFVAFLHNQVKEVADRYDPDVLWFDGDWVRPANGTDAKMGELLDEIRLRHPSVLSANRHSAGIREDFITPEQIYPKKPLDIPWETCMTLATSFSFRYEEPYKTVRQVLHSLMTIVSRGGNLALNITPGPDGTINEKTQERLAAIGSWLRTMGEGVYATRKCAPYQVGNLLYTQSKDENRVYAFQMWDGDEAVPAHLHVPLSRHSAGVKSVTALGTGEAVFFTPGDGLITLHLPAKFRRNAYGDGFCIAF